MTPIAQALTVLLNYWPAAHAVLISLPFWLPSLQGFDWGTRIAVAAGLLYLLPPLLCRLTLALLGRPPERSLAGSRGFFLWWALLQLQIPFLRFPALEEALKFVPGLFSLWLRLWGSKIGRFVYWSPALKIMDRSFLEIGDSVMVGYGVGFTAHHVNFVKDETSGERRLELVFGSNRVGPQAILGGLSGLTPGAEVAAQELLPSSFGLAPFYVWRDGRRHPLRPKDKSGESS